MVYRLVERPLLLPTDPRYFVVNFDTDKLNVAASKTAPIVLPCGAVRASCCKDAATSRGKYKHFVFLSNNAFICSESGSRFDYVRAASFFFLALIIMI